MARLNFLVCINAWCIVAWVVVSVRGLSVQTTATDSSGKSWRNENINPTQAAERNLLCSEVQEIFVMKKIGTAEMVPESPESGLHLQVCKSQSTCCTPEMEEKYKQSVKNNFLNIVHSTSSHVKNSIVSNVDKFQENILDMIRLSENNTKVLLADIYPSIWNEAHDSVTKLFSHMISYMKGEEEHIDLQESVRSLFDILFPLVYHHNINPKLEELSDDYKECMQETQDEIRPFGDIARRLALHVSKSLQAAHVFMQALTLGMKAMNLTDYVLVTPECQRALLRLTHCPHCQGLVSAKPCTGYCLNVMHGCLSGVAEMEQPWNDFISSLETLVSGMRGAYNVEEVMSSLDSKISDAIMYAMDNGPEISKKVVHVCGQPQRTTTDAVHSEELSAATTSNGPDKIVPVRSISTPDLYTRLQKLMKNLSPSKNFFSALADTLCSDDNLGVRSDTNCWNGEGIGDYTKTLVGFGMSAQKYNPEMESVQTMDEKIAQLVDKLKHIRQIILTRANPAAPEGDSVMNDGSGSGYLRKDHNKLNEDDEDYVEGDGSGSGYDGYDEDTETTPRKQNTKKQNPKWTSQKTGSDDDLQIEDIPGGMREGKDEDLTVTPTAAASHIQTSTYMSALNVIVIFILSFLLTAKWW